MKCHCGLADSDDMLATSESCPCGFRAGDVVTVMGDAAGFGHPLRMTEEVLESHLHWSNGPGWRTESGWDVCCSDIEPTITDADINEAIASILKEK
jgi:hypothetical protein